MDMSTKVQDYRTYLDVLVRAISYLLLGAFLLNIQLSAEQSETINALGMIIDRVKVVHYLGTAFVVLAIATTLAVIFIPFFPNVLGIEKRVNITLLLSFFILSLARILDVWAKNLDNIVLRYGIDALFA